MAKSLVLKRSIVVDGHKTSVSLEDAFWNGLREIAEDKEMSLSNLVSNIDADRKLGNLSSAIRLFVLGAYQNQLSESPSMADHDTSVYRRSTTSAPSLRGSR